jgi:hypothetical protein
LRFGFQEKLRDAIWFAENNLARAFSVRLVLSGFQRCDQCAD